MAADNGAATSGEPHTEAPKPTGSNAGNSDAETSARLLADSVTQKLHQPGSDGGAANAYTLLKVEFDKYALDKTHSPEDEKKYWETISRNLSTNGVLPELSISLGKETITEADLLAGTEKDTAATKPARRLDDETLKKTAEELNKAIHATSGPSFWQSAAPEKDKIASILEPLGQEDRKRLEEIYHDKYNPKGGADTLRNELKTSLGGADNVDWRIAEAALNRTDGATNDAGALMVAITNARSDKDKGNAEIRAVLETLNKGQIDKLDADFQKSYGMSYRDALEKANLNEATKDALPILEKGVDLKNKADIIKLATIAVDRGDAHLFGEALRGDSADAKAARQELTANETFKNKVAEKFPSDVYPHGQVPLDAKFEQKVDQVALDYLTEGRISLATITSKNTGKWLFNNEENVSLAAKNASAEERTQFARGREAALKAPNQMTEQEKVDAAFYDKVHKSFKAGGTEKQVAIWEDELAHGQDTLIAALAKTHNDGWGPLAFNAGTNMNDAMTKVEQMNAGDFRNLQDPKYYAQFKESLKSYSSDSEYSRIMSLVDQKLATGDFAKSQNEHRSLDEVVQDSKGHTFLGMGTSYDGKSILDNIEKLSAADAKKYQTDEKFRSEIAGLLNNNLSDTEKMLARRLLDQSAKTGEPPVIEGDAETKFLHDKIHGADNQTLLADAQKMLTENPALRERLNVPIDELKGDDLILKGTIEDALVENFYKLNQPGDNGSYGLEGPMPDAKLQAIADELFKSGSLSLQSKFDLSFPKAEIIADLAKAPEEVRTQMLGRLNEDEKRVLAAAVANPTHELTTADKMRLFVIGDGGQYGDFQSELDNLHKNKDFNGIQNLKDEYTKKYGADLDTDFLDKVSSADKAKYRELLTPANGDGRQPFYDNLHKLLTENGIVVDGTGLTMQRAVDQTATTLEEYQKVYQTLPRDTQQALDKYFNDSLDQYKESKEKLGEIASTALITAAALAAVIATGGAATPLVMAAAFAAGGITKNLVAGAVEGQDFEVSAQNIAKNFVSGGVTAAANFFGGEALGFGKSLASISEAVAGNVAKEVGANAIKEGGREAIERSLPALLARGGGKIADADIGALVDQVAAKGATQAEKDLLRQSIESSVSKQSSTIDGLVNSSQLQQVVKGALESGATGGVVNTGITAIDAVTNGEPLNVQNLLASGLAGFAAGAAIHLGFSGVRAGREYFSAKKIETVPGGKPELYAIPEKGKVEYVKRGDDVFKIDGNESQRLKLQDGDLLLKEPPAGQRFKELPNPDDYAAELAAPANGRPGNSGRYGTTDGSTAPSTTVRINNTLMEPGIPYPGPQGETIYTNNGKAYIKQDARGTVNINGRDIPRDQWVEFKPTDRVVANGRQLTVSSDSTATYNVRISADTRYPGRPLDIQPGQELPLNGPNSARVGMDANGMYVVENSTSTTTVNKRQLNPGEKVYLKPTDDVISDGNFVALMRKDVMRFDNTYRPADPLSVDQANHFGRNQELHSPIKDGYADGGKFYELGPDGKINAAYDKDGVLQAKANANGDLIDVNDGKIVRPRRELITVDRTQDPVLRETIAEAKAKTAGMTDEQKAKWLNEYVHDLLNPGNMDGASLDAWSLSFGKEHAGERIPLGEYIREGKGVCIQQATLLKVLGDEVGLDVTLVRGAALAGDDALNHAWTTIKLPGKSEPLIYDPRWNKSGLTAAEIDASQKGSGRRAGAEVLGLTPPAEPHFAPPQDGAKINGQTIPRDKVIDMGSRPESDIQLGSRDLGVSGKHAYAFTDADGETWVADAGSTNGSYIVDQNGTKVRLPGPGPNGEPQWVAITPGQKLSLGPMIVDVAPAPAPVRGQIPARAQAPVPPVPPVPADDSGTVSPVGVAIGATAVAAAAYAAYVASHPGK